MEEGMTAAVEAAVESVVPENTADVVENAEVAAPAEASSELTDAVEEAIENGATEEEVREMIKEFEIKVNGKKKKIKLDLNDEATLIKKLQMAEAGQMAMADAAEKTKMIEAAIRQVRENPWEFLKEAGYSEDDIYKLNEDFIQKRVEELQRSPEEIEREKIQKELEEARAKLKEQEERAHREHMAQMQEQAALELDREITEALEASQYLPKTRKVVGRIVDALMWAENNGFPGVKAADVIPVVENDIKAEINEMFKVMPLEVMEHYLGKAGLDKLQAKRKAQAEKARQAAAMKVAETTKEEPKSDSKREKIDSRDFFRKLGR